MRALGGITLVLLGAFLLGQAPLIGSPGMPASAQNRSAEKGPLPGREILVAGAGSLANGKTPAQITIDLGGAPPREAKLELALEPVAVVPNEPYFVVVSVKAPSGEKRLGTVSFYPPRAGMAEKFYFDASPLLNEAKAYGTSRMNLSVAVVPASKDDQLKESSIRVVGARLV
jgi:hypothetical protein